MKTLKIVLTSLLVLFWILVSVLYYMNNELTGFYFSQLFFIPLIGGILLLKQERSLGIITLVFWLIIIYGVLNGPFRDEIKFIPYLLLIAYQAKSFFKASSLESKAIILVVSILSIILIVRLSKLTTEFDWTVINQLLLLTIPALLLIRISRHEIKSETMLGKLAIGMAIIMAIEIIVRAIHNHVNDLPSTFLIASTTSMLLVISITTWILYRNNSLEDIRKVSLSYLVWTLFVQLGEWVVNSINAL